MLYLFPFYILTPSLDTLPQDNDYQQPFESIPSLTRYKITVLVRCEEMSSQLYKQISYCRRRHIHSLYHNLFNKCYFNATLRPKYYIQYVK